LVDMPESYRGTKFETVFMNRASFKVDKAKDLVKWAHELAAKGFCPPQGEGAGTSGNLSARYKNGCLITRTGADLGKIVEDEFVNVEDVNMVDVRVAVTGKYEPSSESMVHMAIYRSRRDANAVFHGHSPDILAHARALGVPETKSEVEYGTRKEVEEVLSALKQTHFVVVKGHGFYCLGKTLDECGKRAVEMLEKARALK